MLFKERHNTVLEHLCCHQSVFTIVELRKGHFGIGIDIGLLINASYALDCTDIIRVLSTKIARMFRLDDSSKQRTSGEEDYSVASNRTVLKRLLQTYADPS